MSDLRRTQSLVDPALPFGRIAKIHLKESFESASVFERLP
jgi:hypothetical protein